ncbi:MAG: hypothetical protein AAGG01_17255, partial [Planctomycetota bacterium]
MNVAATLLLTVAAQTGAQVSPEDAVAASTFSPEAVAVGEPVVWTVLVDDPARVGATLSEFELGLEWALLEGPEDVIQPGVPRSERPDVHMRWTLLPLSSGALTVPAITATFEDG